MINSASVPWEYEKFSSLMSSVKEDLKLYDENGLIKDDNYIKVIMKCNEKLGERIHQSRTCILRVSDYKADVPEDLWKIENIYGLSATHHFSTYHNGIFQGTHLAFHDNNQEVLPTGQERITYIGSLDLDTCDNESVGVSKIDYPSINKTFIKHAFPIQLTNDTLKGCVNYSPCKNWSSEYTVDLNNNTFNFSFDKGEVVLTYLGSFVDSDGDLVYPFHPLLNDYYEYSVKKKILEDIMINSDADVINKLAYIEQKCSEHYCDAYSFIKSSKANQYTKLRKKYELEFARKWYNTF